MRFEPTPRQVLAIWRMLFMDETPKFGLLGRRLGKRGIQERQQLIDHGLIDLKPSESSRGRIVVLTDKAWDWAADNLDSEISESRLAAQALEGLLLRMKGNMKRLGLGLADLLGEVAERESSRSDIGHTSSGNLGDRVREAYFSLSGGKSNRRVRLADLRRELNEVDGLELQALLASLQQERKLVLNTINDPREIRSEDHEAAVEIAGIKRHLIYMEE